MFPLRSDPEHTAPQALRTLRMRPGQLILQVAEEEGLPARFVQPRGIPTVNARGSPLG